MRIKVISRGSAIMVADLEYRSGYAFVTDSSYTNSESVRLQKIIPVGGNRSIKVCARNVLRKRNILGVISDVLAHRCEDVIRFFRIEGDVQGEFIR